MSFLWSFAAAQRLKDPAKPAGEAGSTVPTLVGDVKPMNIASFRKGVHYNMKIIIRGDVMTGKTALFNRLQGGVFDPEYAATPQIQVANIQWNYSDTNDIIKVEIWDVVDKGVSNVTSKPDAAIKLEHNPTTPTSAVPPSSTSNTDRQLASQEISLDATNINVYRNTHGVIFLFDITKPWTFEYVVRELDNVPANMAVLVLGNFSDQSAKRTVDLGHIQQTLSEHNQRRLHEKNAIKANLVRYVESSMLNGYGLKFIHRYLGVPFLGLQTDTLRQQLDLKTQELATLLSDLDTSEEVPKGLKRRKASALPQEETRLDKQHHQMQTLWDGEDEGRQSADSHSIQSSSPPPAIITLPSINREASPAPPTSPVRPSRLTSAPPAIASAHTHVPDFDAGELEDDFFTEDVGTIKNVNHDMVTVSAPIPPLQDSDDEWGGAGGSGFNPMVTVDEDVEGVDYVDDEDDVPQQQPASVSQLTPSFPSFRTTEVPAPVRNVWDIPAAQDTDSDYDSDTFVASSVVVPVGDVATRVTQLIPSEVKPVVEPQSRDATGEFGFGGVEFEGFRTGTRGYEEIGGGGGGGRGRTGSGGSNPWAERGLLAKQETGEFYSDDTPTYQSYTSPPSLRSYPTSPTSLVASGPSSPWGAPLGGPVVSSPGLYTTIRGSDHEGGEKKKKAKKKKEKESVESEAKEGKEGKEKVRKKKDGVEKEGKKKSSKAKGLKTGYEDF